MGFKVPFISHRQSDASSTASGMHAGGGEPASERLHAQAVRHHASQAGGVLQADTALTGSAHRQPLPLLGVLPIAQQIRILLSFLVVALLTGTLCALVNSRTGVQNANQTQIAGDALMHSQRIGKAAPNAIQGNADAFRQLDDSRSQFNADLGTMTQGGAIGNQKIGLPLPQMGNILRDVQKAWSGSNQAALTILERRQELTGFGSTLKKLNVQSPLLQDMTQQLLLLKVQGGATSREISAAGELVMLTQRLGRSANALLTGEGANSDTATLLGKDTASFGALIDGFLRGSIMLQLPQVHDAQTRQLLGELHLAFVSYQQSVATILVNLHNFTVARQAEQVIVSENEMLKQQLSVLQNAYRTHQDALRWPFWAALGSGMLALACACCIALVIVQDTRDRAQEAVLQDQQADAKRLQAQLQDEQAKGANAQNQAAILRLMNELQEVADGDLTVQATVSEDITGAIADSVNYTVEELRGLMGRVTTTAESVMSASAQARHSSNQLLLTSRQQSREIQETGHAVLDMAQQITNVSRSANASAEVAQQSVSAADQGARAMDNAIRGMNDIREQMQETAKRVKRLGESSQEIGEITELISDITEQTNVLALNAAIQAASAGEAGRGFSVVAEEVQRLAERSGEATRQIGALVRTIQADTHDAVAAMEKSTQSVVEGARLSDAAGAALSEIRQVSTRLAELIQSISFSAEQQATSANGVAKNIQNILNVTQHTQQGTQQTALSIRELSKLAEELKNSVSRFRVTP